MGHLNDLYKRLSVEEAEHMEIDPAVVLTRVNRALDEAAPATM